LKSAASLENLSLLTVPDQNPTMFRGKVSLIVPPLVLTSILEAKTMCPLVLIPIPSAKFQEFDRSSTQAKACTSLHMVLEFLWETSKKLVPPSVVALASIDDGRDWSDQFHFAYIKPAQHMPCPPPFLVPPPPPAQSTPPFDSIAGDIRIIRDATECQLLRDIQNEDGKKDIQNGWDKLPDVVQGMILKSSAISDDVPLTSPAESYLKLLKQQKALGVAVVINIELSL